MNASRRGRPHRDVTAVFTTRVGVEKGAERFVDDVGLSHGSRPTRDRLSPPAALPAGRRNGPETAAVADHPGQRSGETDGRDARLRPDRRRVFDTARP